MALKDLLRDLPAAGAVGTAVASIGDFLFYGGDYIVEVLFFVIGTLDLWLPFMSRLASVAQVVDWLPEDLLQRLVLALTVLFVVVTAIRLLKRWRQRQ